MHTKIQLCGNKSPHVCLCGYFTDPRHECACTPHHIQRYMSKISGPLMDRIDIHVEVPALSYEELAGKSAGEDSQSMRTKVAAARSVQQQRFTEDARHKIFCNAPGTCASTVN